MSIHFSSATVQSYENKDKSMDLFYNPIVIFEGFSGFSIEQIKDIKWSIESEKIGLHEFDVILIKNPDITITEDKNFVEFRLSKKDVSFEYDNYCCKLKFCATLELFDEKPLQIEHEVLGVAKTKWSKGLI